MISIKTILNNPVESNCYVVSTRESNKCILIDPGSKDSSELIDFMKINNLIPDHIILTHEHFDHIWGVKHLKKIYDVNVMCSQICAENIVNSKKNMSAFFTPPGFKLDEPDTIIDQNCSKLFWDNYKINFYQTPGHTYGSISFTLGNYLFTGDTLIKNEKTVTKLPGGNSLELNKSLKLLISLMTNETIIMSGHGDSFHHCEI